MIRFSIEMSETQLPFEKIKRQILLKREAEPGVNYGTRPEDRPTEEFLNKGIVCIDKPRGPTSHQVSAYVQSILCMDKGGHGGTLDPKVTGILPVALGKATRIVQALLPAGKEYVMMMHVHKEIEPTKLRETIMEFVGKIKQLPPIKSAVKREWRFRRIYYIEIIEMESQDVLMRVGCQAGTYMRKLASDIGDRLGVGAHMAELRRTKAGPFNESLMTNLHDLTDAYWQYKKEGNDTRLRKMVLPVEFGVSHLGKIWVTDSTVDTLCHGANLNLPGISKLENEIQPDDLVAIMTLKNELICIGKAKMPSQEMLKSEKGLAVIVDKVFMDPGTYPKMARKEITNKEE
jgi:H/ACA ribonucleoprotein complex subunit 4